MNLGTMSNEDILSAIRDIEEEAVLYSKENPAHLYRTLSLVLANRLIEESKVKDSSDVQKLLLLEICSELRDLNNNIRKLYKENGV